MITTPEEYNSHLALIQNANPPIYALLPSIEQVYNIDLQSRIIEAPKFISVKQDHKAETIYFIVDRYNGYMDLASTSCLIHYQNALGEGRYYMVPFYDIYTKEDENKIIFPWCVDACLTKQTGNITFSFQFFKMGEPILNPETNEMQPVLLYNFNTLPAITKVLQGFNVQATVNDSYFLLGTQAQELQSQIDQIKRWNQVYWTVLSDSVYEEKNDENLQDTLKDIVN